ncbi:MAG TPA: aspartate aminotransferase family protein [Planctomycetota bacterium]|nr:aspartate aminotransferase family protein [Planctomycetota bacterium]
MAGKVYGLEPRDVPRINTSFRRIVTKIPVPESIPILRTLQECEPISMQGQPPVVWDRAEGFQVYDRWGNMWLDWSSGVLVTNAGHGRKEIVEAIASQARHGLLHSYCFANEPRAKLAKRLADLANDAIQRIAGQGRPAYRVFLLTTGGETTENAVKLARTYGQKVGGRKKIGVVSFERAFHGRTLGAQQIGGIPALKEWIGNLDPDFHQVPFPDGFRTTDTSFGLFLRTLAAKGVGPERVAGVITETYQGGGADFAPRDYMQALAAWCREHDILLILDEVQAAFGRTGTYWGFEHYGVAPDIICCGKGITSSLPLGAVIGRDDVIGLYGPGEMTSTHSGNPVCCAAALANLDLIEREGLAENARVVGDVLHGELGELQARFPDRIGAVHGKGLVAGVLMVKPGTKEPDGDLAFEVVRRSVEKGLLFFSPVGFGGGTVKIAPPLCITTEAVREGTAVLCEALAESIEAR